MIIAQRVAHTSRPPNLIAIWVGKRPDLTKTKELELEQELEQNSEQDDLFNPTNNPTHEQVIEHFKERMKEDREIMQQIRDLYE
jgi:hypothetical protein